MTVMCSIDSAGDDGVGGNYILYAQGTRARMLQLHNSTQKAFGSRRCLRMRGGIVVGVGYRPVTRG